MKRYYFTLIISVLFLVALDIFGTVTQSAITVNQLSDDPDVYALAARTAQGDGFFFWGKFMAWIAGGYSLLRIAINSYQRHTKGEK